jgi:cytochrome P450 family 4
MLLNDDIYKSNDRVMMDECMTFIGAATQTTTFLLTNCCYYLTKNPEIRKKLVREIKENIFTKAPPKASFKDPKTWQDLLVGDGMLDNCPYLQQVIYETLRIESSATISSAIAMTETCQIYDKVFRSDSQIMVAIHRLHHNPDQWQEPERFIPERFSSDSKYFLTPEGKRRSPMSFGPFLGGKRICLGKTFAENVAKALLPIIICQVEFGIPEESDIVSDAKPSLSHFSGQPPYIVTLKEL